MIRRRTQRTDQVDDAEEEPADTDEDQKPSHGQRNYCNPSHPPTTTVPVPLAHPQSITTTNNYDEPCVAIAFATSRLGEPLADFKHRIAARDHYTRTRWVELVLDQEAATELVRLLIPVVGRTEIGLLIDSP